MGISILDAFAQLTHEKRIGKTELIGMIEDGLKVAARKRFGPMVDADVKIEPSNGQVIITLKKEVVETIEQEDSKFKEILLPEALSFNPEAKIGDVIEVQVNFKEFGRNAVQAAKQVVIQRVREAERDRIREEYGARIGELITGSVQQVGREDYLIFINKQTEAVLSKKEVNKHDRFKQGDMLRACLINVRETTKGPQLTLSRTHPDFVKALFKLEVPEIYQGIVDIKGISRIPGYRSKVAVASQEENVDAVGACVGLKGSRVQAVVNELGGERIDIVQWSEDPESFVKRALSPANVALTALDAEEKKITVVVEEDQLSLAIGKSGRNVRLACKLTGWNIDLVTTKEYREKMSAKGETIFRKEEFSKVERGETEGGIKTDEDFPLTDIPGIGGKIAEKIAEAGYNTFDDIIDLERQDFLDIPGIGEKTADRLMSIIEELTEEVDEFEDVKEKDTSLGDGLEDEEEQSEEMGDQLDNLPAEKSGLEKDNKAD